MTEVEFCRWLQGYAELAKGRPTPAQWKAIKKHLQLVYTKVTTEPKAPKSKASLPVYPHWADLHKRIC